MRTIERALAITTIVAAAITAPLFAQSADVSVVKTGPANATPGSNITYTVTVSNSGPADAVNVTLTDNIPAQMTFDSASQSGTPFLCTTPNQGDPGTVSCNAALLPSGASTVFTLVFTVDGDTPNGTVVFNTASVSATTPDPDNGDNAGTAETFVSFNADLFTTKTGPDLAAADTDVSYTVTITNSGPNDAPNVVLSDQTPAGMTFVSVTQNSGTFETCASPDILGVIKCPNDVLLAGESATFTFVFHIPTGTPAGTTFTNTATAKSDASDPNPENDGSFANTSTPAAPQSDMVITKTGPTGAAPDTNVTYTIVVSNNGPDAATGVTMTDELATAPEILTFVSLMQSGEPMSCTTPAVGSGGNITCTAATYPAGASTTFTLTAHVPASAEAGDELTNTAEVTATSSDPNVENNGAAATTIVSTVDIEVVKTGSTTADAGTNLTYTITVTNQGPDPAVNVTLEDILPPNTTFVSFSQNNPAAVCSAPPPGANGTFACSLGTLGFGASMQFTLTIEIGNTLSVTNTARAQTDSFDTDTGDNQSTVITTVTPVADVSVVKSGPATLTAGDDFVYTITVRNDGPSDASTVSLDDTLPANVTVVSASQTSGPAFTCTFPAPGTTGAIDCDIATLVPDAPATFSVTVMLSPSAPEGSTVSNTANVTAATTDPDGSNNTSTTMATVDADADVSVMKTGPASVLAGSNISYTVTVENAGFSDAVNVTLSDVVPQGTVFVSATQNSGPVFSCATPAPGNPGTITCTIASMPADTSSVFTFVLRVTGGGPIENTATVSSPTDSTPGNGSSTTSAAVSHGEGVPTLSQFALIAMALSLAVIVMMRLR